jgi:hypothetical protein
MYKGISFFSKAHSGHEMAFAVYSIVLPKCETFGFGDLPGIEKKNIRT